MPSNMPREPEPERMDLPEEAQAYAQADFTDVNEKFVQRLIEHAGGEGAAVALDLGTGPADISIRVARACPDWTICAMDAAHAMLTFANILVATNGVGEQILLVEGDAKRLPLPDDAINVVYSNSILHHINETEQLWRELARVARPGALVLMRDLARPVDDQTARWLVQEYAGDESALLQEEFYRSLRAAYTCAEVRDQIERAGLGKLGVEMVSDRHLDVVGRL